MNKEDREIRDEVRKLFINRDSDSKITYTGAAYISRLLGIVDRLDKQNQEVQTLLERVLEIDKVFDDDDPDKPMAWHKLCLDVKTLLKEAKEVK